MTITEKMNDVVYREIPYRGMNSHWIDPPWDVPQNAEIPTIWLQSTLSLKSSIPCIGARFSTFCRIP